MVKNFVIFGATGSQGGAIASELLKTKGQYDILAITRNKDSDRAKRLEHSGATLVQADQNDLESVKRAVRGAQVIFGVTDFMGAVPYQNVVHFNAKNDITKSIGSSPYFQNFVKAPQVYGPQKLSNRSWESMLFVEADSQMPFTSVRGLGRVVEVILVDLAKFCTKTVSVVSQKVTPLEMLKSWNEAVGLRATFKPLSTKEFEQRLKTVYKFQDVFAVALAESLSIYWDDPEAWSDGTDFAIRDLVPNLETWEEYVKQEGWDAFFKSIESAA